MALDIEIVKAHTGHMSHLATDHLKKGERDAAKAVILASSNPAAESLWAVLHLEETGDDHGDLTLRQALFLVLRTMERS